MALVAKRYVVPRHTKFVGHHDIEKQLPELLDRVRLHIQTADDLLVDEGGVPIKAQAHAVTALAMLAYGLVLSKVDDCE